MLDNTKVFCAVCHVKPHRFSNCIGKFFFLFNTAYICNRITLTENFFFLKCVNILQVSTFQQ